MLIGRAVKFSLVNQYVKVCDMLLLQCLLNGSMPPRYSLGVAKTVLFRPDHLTQFYRSWH